MPTSFPRIEAALGGALLEDVSEPTLQLLIDGQVREETEIEFKEALYGNSEAEHRDLATDVGALANSLGGVIFLGVREENGVAVELTPVPLDEREDIRMRQILAGLVAPFPEVSVIRVESSSPGRGYCLLAIAPSTWRPHAVRVGPSLRYPQRDGPRVRYLSETEIADAYRSRFTAEATQRERLDLIRSEGLERLSTDNQVWLSVALVPNVPGAMRLDRSVIQDFRDFGHKYSQGFGSMVFGGVDVATGLRRVVLKTGPDRGPSNVAHVELHADGSAFAATSAWQVPEGPPEGRVPEGPEGTPWLVDEVLVEQLIGLTRLAVEHATVHCGVSSNAALRVGLDGYDRGDGRYKYPARFMHRRRYGLPEPRSRVEALRSPVSLHTVNVPAAFQAMPEMLIVCRIALMDLFQAFGVPEVEHIGEQGALRLPYFESRLQNAVAAWAEKHGVSVLTSTIEEEASV